MTRRLPLSILATLIQETIEQVFEAETFWVIAEITDVKKYAHKRWCFLKLIEKNKEHIVTEMQAVLWANAFAELQQFERRTGQAFADGLEISCRVAVRFHPRYGLKLEILEIDSAFTLGQIELQRQQTLDLLLRQYPSQIQLVDGDYITANKQLQWPKVLQRIALIAATGSDGERDFLQELQHNAYGYDFNVQVFTASVQGQQAVQEITAQLDEIRQQASSFDVVAIVRGGGSNTDFAAFDHFDIARRIALFPIPVFTGIGHDRNTSIADMMGWQFKTPTKVAAAIVAVSLQFDSDLMQLNQQLTETVEDRMAGIQQQLQHWQQKLSLLVPHRLQRQRERLHDLQLLIDRSSKDQWKMANDALQQMQLRVKQSWQHQLRNQQVLLEQTSRLIEQVSPDKILNRGFAMLLQNDRIITDASQLDKDKPLQTVLKNNTIHSHISDIRHHE